MQNAFIIAALALSLATSACQNGDTFTGGNDSQRAAAVATPTPTPQSSPLAVATPTPVPTPMPVQTPYPVLPPNAVTQGNFSVWTVPARPAPMQDYQIFISIRLPSNITALGYFDVGGFVDGTDGYRRGIGALAQGEPGDSFQPMGNTALMSLWVPGAHNLVQDVISVSVAKMAQSERITIIFGGY